MPFSGSFVNGEGAPYNNLIRELRDSQLAVEMALVEGNLEESTQSALAGNAASNSN